MRRNSAILWFKACIGCGVAGAMVMSCGGADDARHPAAMGGDSDAAGSTSGEGGSSGKGGSGATSGSAGEGGISGRQGEAGHGGQGTGGADGEGVSGAGGAGAECAQDGAACDGGLCSRGSCVSPAEVSSDTDLSAGSITPGRTCAEAPEFSVTSLAATSATLGSAPADDCLAPGDEVLLINLQGAGDKTDNVGNWELLTIKSVAGAKVTFTAPKQRTYGDPPDTDAAIGTGAQAQKVALIRVPHFGALTIADGQTLTAAAWDGALGGVVALRAVSLDVAGTISAAGLGYRSGRWSTDNSDCDDNVTTEAGESISGPGSQTTSHNAGGPGGLSAGADVSFNDNSPICASAGHSSLGEPGINPNGRTIGEPGAAYGVNDASRLTMGSGAAGNMTCTLFDPGPSLQQDHRQPAAGGVVLLLVDSLTVRASGAITATAPQASRDVASSGGYVFIRGDSLSLGDQRVTAQGAVAQGGTTPTRGQSNQASAGYIVLQSGNGVLGTTDPPAHVLP